MGLGHLLFGFSGRINRAKFWLGNFLSLLIMAVLFGIGIALGSFGAAPTPRGATPTPSIISLIPMGIGLISLIWSQFAVMIKRCHDRNKSGWWSLITLIPLAGGIWWLIDLGALEGEPGTNQWGRNPLEGRATVARA